MLPLTSKNKGILLPPDGPVCEQCAYDYVNDGLRYLGSIGGNAQHTIDWLDYACQLFSGTEYAARLTNRCLEMKVGILLDVARSQLGESGLPYLFDAPGPPACPSPSSHMMPTSSPSAPAGLGELLARAEDAVRSGRARGGSGGADMGAVADELAMEADRIGRGWEDGARTFLSLADAEVHDELFGGGCTRHAEDLAHAFFIAGCAKAIQGGDAALAGAAELLARAVGYDPTRVPARTMLASTLANLGREDEALGQLAAARAVAWRTGDVAVAHHMLGCAMMSQQLPNVAWAHLMLAYDYEPSPEVAADMASAVRDGLVDGDMTLDEALDMVGEEQDGMPVTPGVYEALGRAQDALEQDGGDVAQEELLALYYEIQLLRRRERYRVLGGAPDARAAWSGLL